jgi:hypothetical protein
MEFILIFAFSLVIIIPIVNLMHEQYAQNKEELDESQARQVMDEMSIAMQNAYYAGYPSRTTLTIYFPDGIKSIGKITAEGDTARDTMIFTMSRGGEEVTLPQPLPFGINISLNPNDGKRKVLIKAEPTGYVNVTDAP